MVSSKAYNFTVVKRSKGIFTVKFEKCKWHQVMKELEDSELAYYILCYGDFRAAQFYSENFILTRTQTLMEGKEYCDFCWHDTELIRETNTHPRNSGITYKESFASAFQVMEWGKKINTRVI